jgi:hypothetical protein
VDFLRPSVVNEKRDFLELLHTLLLGSKRISTVEMLLFVDGRLFDEQLFLEKYGKFPLQLCKWETVAQLLIVQGS